MVRMYFIRHAEAEGNVNGRFHGYYDSDITETGEKQLKELAKMMYGRGIDKIYTSDLKRAVKTAEVLKYDKDIPVITDPLLREINGGDWENERWVDLPKKWPKEYDNWENHAERAVLPNGESMKEFEDRIVNRVLQIAKENEGLILGMVTHGTAIRTYISYIKGFGLENINEVEWYDNTSVTLVEFNKWYKPTIFIEGDNSHLNPEISKMKMKDWLTRKKFQEELDAKYGSNK